MGNMPQAEMSLVFLTGFVLLLFMSSRVQTFKCPSSCECKDMYGDRYRCYKTPEGSVFWSPEHKYVEISCRQSFFLKEDDTDNHFNYTSIPQMLLSTDGLLHRFEVIDCDLPRTFTSVFERIGVVDVLILEINGVQEELRHEHVQGLRSVQRLNILRDAYQTSIPFDVFNTLAALEEVTIEGASLKLEANGGNNFPSHTTLLELKLVESKITEIPSGAFMQLSCLEKLNLRDNKIVSFSNEAFRGLANLTSLDLSFNPLASVPPRGFIHTPHLRKLTLYNTHIAEISSDAFEGLNYLQIITFEMGYETAVFGSRALGALASLVDITIQKINIDPLPGDLLENSTELARLVIKETSLELLPRHLFKSQQKMKALDLSMNDIKTLDREIFWPLTELTELNLDGNYIEELPDKLFFDLTNLRTLSANKNRLRHIAANAFINVPSLNYISITDNLLTFDGGTPRFPFENLSELRLDGNKITKLQPEWVTTGIKILNLARNKFTRITNMDLNLITNDMVVDLRQNNITTVNQLRVDLRKPSHKRLSGVLLLDNNPFECNCGLYMFAKIVHSKRSFLLEHKLDATFAKCASPPDLAGLFIRDVPLSSLMCKLRSEDCPTNCICNTRPATRTIELDCDSEPSYYPDPRTYEQDKTQLRLRSIQYLTLPSHIHFLNLTGIGLTKPPPVSFLQSIKELDLSHNLLTSAPIELLEGNMSLRLTGNPFVCDCSHLDDIKVLQKEAARIADVNNIKCGSGESIIHIKTAMLCQLRNAVLLGGSLAAMCLLLGVAVGISYRYNYEIKVFLFSRGWCQSLTQEDDLDENAQYDAFVSFSQEDARWVAEHLLPKLEGEPYNYRLCVHYRDWVVGEMIPAQIAASVEQSRRTIVVLTEHFLKSTWAPLEFRAANLRAQRERRTRVLIVVLGDIPDCEEMDAELRAYLSTNTYLKLGDPWFWEKLKYAMPHRRLIVR